jgi:hypothetical protein
MAGQPSCELSFQCPTSLSIHTALQGSVTFNYLPMRHMPEEDKHWVMEVASEATFTT